MAARAIASGTITFGLVSVPVKLYGATQSKDLSFRMLHATDHGRVRQQYVCTECEQVVQRDDTVRGYEYAKGQFVILTKEELESLERKTDQSIEIDEFVPISEVDPIYFEHAYYLGPDKGGAKPYRLLCMAMQKTGRCAVAKFSTRGKQQLVLLRERSGALVLHALYHADEVRDLSEIDRGEEVSPKPAEVDLAVKLIDELGAGSFDPAKYDDEYRKAALEMIERKVAGKEVVLSAASPPKAQIIDLMEALRASLGNRSRKPARGEARREAEQVAASPPPWRCRAAQAAGAGRAGEREGRAAEPSRQDEVGPRPFADRRLGLKEYRGKRRFGVTPEPAGRDARTQPRRRKRRLSFVVQKHRATQLHYDFRLEWDGVLLSWAVPKGPSPDPAVKRLAMAVEDHPFEYAKFEGVIPEGEYGGGTVMVWDAGTYTPEEPDVGASVRKGELKFALEGEKLRGSWVLVRTRGRSAPGGGERSWLLIKHRDEFASSRDLAESLPRSVVSGRLLAEIAIDEGGDVTKAATGDPAAEIRALLADPATARRKRKRKPAVWHTKGVS